MAIVVGIIIGLVLGLTGAGGSVFAVPLLIFVVGLDTESAVAMSLAAVAIASSLGVLTKLKSGAIYWQVALSFAVLGSLFTPIGYYFHQRISEQALLTAFSLLVIIVAVKLWRKSNDSTEDNQFTRSNISYSLKDNHEKINFWYIISSLSANKKVRLTVGAIVTGCLSGLFGVGGGFIVVPTLIFLLSLSMKQAVATSLVVISIISTSGVINYLAQGGTMDTSILLQVGMGGLLGMLLAMPLSKKLAGAKLQKIFSGLMLLMAVMTLIKLSV